MANSWQKGRWIAAGVGVAVALAYLFDSRKGATRRRRLSEEIDQLARQLHKHLEDSLDASLGVTEEGRGLSGSQPSGTPGGRLVAKALGGTLALYGLRSRSSSDAQTQRWVSGSVGLRAAGR